jgi:hypothetical protein
VAAQVVVEAVLQIVLALAAQEYFTFSTNEYLL